MATISKSSKINFYKFVPIKGASSSAGLGKQDIALVKTINANTTAINNLGATVNSLAKVVKDLKSVALLNLKDSKPRSNFTANYTRPTKPIKSTLAGGGGGGLEAPGFLESLFNLFGSIFKAAVAIPALKWIADEKNQKKVKDVITFLSKVVKFIGGIATFAVTNTVDGLYALFSDETSPWEKFEGAIKGLVGVGTALLAIRWLSNPTKIISDFAGALRFFNNNLQRARKKARGFSLPSFRRRRKDYGGSVPQRSQGGWIRGPQSGYKVSLDGGRSTSFIGHGTEYVARKSNGGAFVIPFNTPGTKTNPHLTQKRIGEAKRQGYQLPGFANGGPFLDNLRKRDGTKGNPDHKKIYLHWSAGARNNTALNGDLGYQAYIKTNGVHMHGKYGETPPYHTYMKNGANAAGIGIAGGAGITRERQAAWTSPNAPTPGQYQLMAKEAAGLATLWGWKPSDITNKRVRTHSEEYKDNKAAYAGHFRWDLEKLYGQDPLGSGPNKIRKMIKSEMGKLGGQTGTGTTAEHDDRQMPQGAMRTFTGIADALTFNQFDFDQRGNGSTAPAPPTTASPTVERTGSRGSPFWTLAAVAGMEDSDPQGWADVAQSVYNRAASGVYGSRDIRSLLLRNGQYEPTWKFPRAGRKNIPNQEWHNITDAESAAKAMGRSPQYVKNVAKALENKTLQAEAAKFVGGRTDFMGGNEKPRFDKGDVRRKNHMPNNFFGWFVGPGAIAYGKRNPGAAGIPDMTGVVTGSAPGGSSGGGAIIGSGGTGAERRPMFGGISINDLLGGRSQEVPNMQRPDTQSKEQREKEKALTQITKDRNAARQQINEKTRQIVQTALEAVGVSNQENQQLVATAAQSIQQLMSRSSQTPAPQFIPQGGTGGGGGGGFISGSGLGRALGGNTGALIGGTAAAILNSFNNPLKGIFF